jgi:hypothetical protein
LTIKNLETKRDKQRCPPKKPLKSVDDANKGKNTVMSQYFKRKSLGRRPKAHALCTDDVGVIATGRKKRGTVPGAARKKKTKTMAAIVGDGGLDGICPSLLKPAKVQRVNWGAGDPLQRLTEAVKDWDSSTGSALDTIGNKLSLRSFAIAVGISASTLMAYVRNDNKRSNPGDSAGRPPLLTARNQGFIRNVLARKDRANEGANYQDAVDLVQELDPKLTQEQARHHLSRTLMKGDTSIVKAKAVVDQQTTTKRSNITVPQQYQWHQTYEHSLDELHRKNTGVCRISGKTFGELIHYFITAGDETNLMASDDNRGVKVIGAANRKKHEKKSADCRSSISLYRTGAVAGDTGPTIFLMKGKTKRHGFTDQYLRSNGCAIGSTVIMTENVFMNVAAWELMTPNIILGLRNINKYVAANPQWWVLEICYGFGAHLLSHKANEERFAAKIMSLKEEGDTSHVCQAYDKHVAKGDKDAKSLSLSFLRTGFKVSNLLIYQWSLVQVGMFAVRDTTRECCTQSFDSCNLDPRTRVSFGEWCERICHFLQGGESFVLETFNSDSEAYHIYSMLPA